MSKKHLVNQNTMSAIIRYMNEVQERIEALRQKGWTLAAIADELEVTNDAVGKWRAGDRYPKNAKGVFEILDGLLQYGTPPKKRRYKKKLAEEGADNTDKQPLEVVAGEPDRPLVIGEVEIPCYVLEDETRVLSQGGFLVALGRSRTPKAGTGGLSNVDELPFFLRSANLRPFISKELTMSTNPILFRLGSGQTAVGYDALLLPRVCDVYLRARDTKVLLSSQRHIARRCELLIRGLATVGIIALVDEATGYQDIRARRSLATILEKFIAKELQPWTRTFPYEFYQQIFRLKGWPGSDGVKRPSVIGHYTNNFVYERLAPGLLDELQTVNPTESNGVRRHRHHQWFTPELGHPKLKEHLAAVTALMRAASNWAAFERSVDRAFPKLNEQTVMLLDDD